MTPSRPPHPPSEPTPDAQPERRSDSAGPDICDICGSDQLVWRQCKLICQSCRSIVKSCADL